MAKPGTPLILLAIIGGAYWYWTGPYELSAIPTSGDDPKKNAQIVADCVARGGFEQADSHKGPGASPESLCADENNLGYSAELVGNYGLKMGSGQSIRGVT